MPVTPIPNSYWVEPGRLLAGEHPWGGSKVAMQRRVDLLVAAGVRSFINLTQEGELPVYQDLLPGRSNYLNLPIRDHSIPENADQMREIQQLLAHAVRKKAAVYVHCRAGIGRTGITIGCYLREQGMAPQRALDRLNELWSHNARAASWPTVPETAEQERYILDWKVEVARGQRA